MHTQGIHSIILVLVIIVSFFIPVPFYHYEFFFIALILTIYVMIKTIVKPIMLTHRLIDSSIFGLIVISIVNSTGGIHSPLFFLLYCLIFALSLLLEPFVSLAAALSLMLLYVLYAPLNQTINDLLPVFSLAFISPFGIFLGEEYQKILEQKKDIIILKKRNEDLQEKIKKLIHHYEEK